MKTITLCRTCANILSSTGAKLEQLNKIAHTATGYCKHCQRKTSVKIYVAGELVLMNREQFTTMLDSEFGRIKDLFALRNESYGSQDDLFYNFRETARRELPEEYRQNEPAAMFKVAEILLDKHNTALAKGIAVNEVRERLQDRIVYSLLQIAMVDDMAKQEPGNRSEWNGRCDCCNSDENGVEMVSAVLGKNVHLCRDCVKKMLDWYCGTQERKAVK